MRNNFTKLWVGNGAWPIKKCKPTAPHRAAEHVQVFREAIK